MACSRVKLNSRRIGLSSVYVDIKTFMEVSHFPIPFFHCSVFLVKTIVLICRKMLRPPSGLEYLRLAW